MNIETLEANKMEAIRELSKISSEVANGKAELSKMKVELQEFLDKREQLEKDRIKKLFEESKELVDSINTNFDIIHNYYNEVRSYSTFLGEFHESLLNIMEEMNKDSNAFMELVKKEESRVALLKKESEIVLNDIETERKQIKKDKELIKKEHARIDSRQSLLAQSYKELKKLWNQTK